MENKFAKVIFDGSILIAQVGTRLSDVVFVNLPCGAHAKCGKCKVIASGALSAVSDAEKSLLSVDEIRAGVRLACSTFIEGDCEVKLYSHASGARILTESESGEYAIRPSFTKYGVAVDIGTTTLAAKLFDTNGVCLSSATCMNPQSRWGADVISRIEAALSGKSDIIAEVIRSAVSDLCKRLAADAKIDALDIEELVITGNSAMLHLLTATSVEPLSRAPFIAERLFGEEIGAKELGIIGLSDNAMVYLPRCIGSFVGADTLCAIIASGMTKEDSASLLVDVGTNGEMAIFKEGELTVCSTAAGPAFEGAGISMGMMGEDGAIDSVTLVNGKLTAHVIGEREARGICGSGLVDAAACLLETEELDESGYLDDTPYTVSGAVSVSQEDIRALQLAKSAICAGVDTLLEESDIDVVDVSRFYVAGGFGSYLNMKSAERIGLFPRGLSTKTLVVGNAALEGASMLLLDPTLRAEAQKISESAKLLELSGNPDFAEKYIRGMAFE